jgi:hypothetical protein
MFKVHWALLLGNANCTVLVSTNSTAGQCQQSTNLTKQLSVDQFNRAANSFIGAYVFIPLELDGDKVAPVSKVWL